MPWDLPEAMVSFNSLKHTAVDDDVRSLPAKEVDENDIAGLAALYTAAGVPPEDVAACAMFTTSEIMREVRRSGMLRAANQKQLNALIFSVWMDGVGVGLHYGAGAPDPIDPEGEPDADPAT